MERHYPAGFWHFQPGGCCHGNPPPAANHTRACYDASVLSLSVRDVGEWPLLRWRLISAGVILSILFTLLVLDFRQACSAVTGLWLAPVFVVVAVLAAEEVLSLLAAKGHAPIAWPIYLGTVALALAACAPIWMELASGSRGEKAGAESRGSGAALAAEFGAPLVALGMAMTLVFFVEIRRYRQPGQAIVHIALSTLTLVYVGVLSGFIAALRLYAGNRWGMAAVVSLLLIVKFADTGAYACGRLWGRHKLTPRLSPGKTVEGAIGGVVTACAASFVFFHYLAPAIVGPHYIRPAWWGWLVYGLVLAISGMVGDLGESLLKREMGRKDSSTWLPGLGGVLDVIDSILVAAPFAYLCWLAGIVGPG